MGATGGGGRRLARRLAVGAAALALAWGLLLVPDREPEVPPAPPGARPFAWASDARWDALERGYRRTREAGCAAAGPALLDGLQALEARIAALRGAPRPPGDPALAAAEAQVFDLAAGAAACPAVLPDLAGAVARLRDAAKRQSERWPPGDRAAREALYRILYGSRAAVEEAMLQQPDGAPGPALTPGVDEPSATPSAEVAGVTIHSGDLLLSRGGAATSALIAVGIDFPGNFSHVAIVHVDEATRRPAVVEAHIERGLAVTAPDAYFRDRKLRILVLRPRADLPALRADPLLPHRAAAAALARARAGHVAYDFAMDWQDPARLFCAEVAADAYRRQGVALWPTRSQLSGPGVRGWLAALGVRHFETLEPSDLEYDPQLRVVAEWRDPAALRQDHLDDAATRAILEAADAGAPLRHDRWRLPLARLAKAWSVALEALGRVGPVPEGMSATAALRTRWYSDLHARLRARVEARARAEAAAQGHPPPSWRLLRLAREELVALGEAGPVR